MGKCVSKQSRGSANKYQNIVAEHKPPKIQIYLIGVPDGKPTKDKHLNFIELKFGYKSKYINNIISGYNFSIFVDNKYEYACTHGGINSETMWHAIKYFYNKHIKIKKIITYPCPQYGRTFQSADHIYYITNQNNIYLHGDKPSLISNVHNVIDMQYAKEPELMLCGTSCTRVINYWYNRIPDAIANIIDMYYMKRQIYMQYSRAQKKFAALKTDINIIKIRCMKHFYLFLDDYGFIWTVSNILEDKWWLKDYRLKYFLDKNIRIKDIECGGSVCLAVDDSDSLYTIRILDSGERFVDVVRYFDKDRIVEIKCGYPSHYYVKTADNKHYLFGDYTGSKMLYNPPLCINDAVNIKGKEIKCVSLGYRNTKVIVSH